MYSILCLLCLFQQYVLVCPELEHCVEVHCQLPSCFHFKSESVVPNHNPSDAYLFFRAYFRCRINAIILCLKLSNAMWFLFPHHNALILTLSICSHSHTMKSTVINQPLSSVNDIIIYPSTCAPTSMNSFSRILQKGQERLESLVGPLSL